MLCALALIGQVAHALTYNIEGVYYYVPENEENAVWVSSATNHKYKGDIVIPEVITADGKTYTVTAIASYAFDGCTDLHSISIPKTVTKIMGYAFRNCTNLDKVYITDLARWCEIDFAFDDGTNPLYYAHNLYINGKLAESIAIPNSVATISSYTFDGCTSLKSVTLPQGVTEISAGAFRRCTNLSSINIPNGVKTIGGGAFRGCTGLTSIQIPDDCEFDDTAFSGCTGLFGWRNLEQTQTTITCIVDKWNFKGSSFYVKLGDDSKLANVGEKIKFIGLSPDKEYFLSLRLKKSSTQHLVDYEFIRTKSITISLSKSRTSPTSITLLLNRDIGDLPESEVEDEKFSLTYGRMEKNGNYYTLYGLKPDTDYEPVYEINLKNGSRFVNHNDIKVRTGSLKLKTLSPKVVSVNSSIAAATTNIVDDETNVGFQWKKYDAPASLKPNEGYSAVYDGTLEGYIKNLQPTYYNVRAFYKAADNTYYYGDWVTFDQSDFSYFEPTVHTYDATDVTSNTAKVKGYVMPGTDEVLTQGFEYWVKGSPSKPVIAYVPTDSGDITTVLASGQVMTTTLDNLKGSAVYGIRAFVKTGKGITYGEERTFTTLAAAGVDIVESSGAKPRVKEAYDIHGHRLETLKRGSINIVKLSDGSVKKILVK